MCLVECVETLLFLTANCPLGVEEGGLSRRGFSAIVGELGFLQLEIGCCKEFLLEFNTSLAIATSGWMTYLLLQDHPLQTPPPIRSSVPGLKMFRSERRI